MNRKTIFQLPDAEMYQANAQPADTARAFFDATRSEQERRRHRLFMQLGQLTRLFLNEGIAFEEVLSDAGMKNFSAALYALEWAEIYYRAVEERSAYNSRSYLRRLWAAIRGL